MVGAMAKFRYECASVVVYDPVAQHRNATRMALYSLGFGKVSASETLDALNRSVKHVPPDLVLCEAGSDGSELCDHIQTLRLGTEGHVNPFLVIIVTAWEKSRELAHKVIDSGADDLILRPFSTGILKSRIDTHIEHRKGFVVTHNYVGPDRRSALNRPLNVELFSPPNSLKMKTMDGLTMPEANFRLQQELRRAKGTLANERLTREAFQICILWRLLQEDDDADSEDHRTNLARLALAVAKRCRESDLEGALQWCDSIVAAVEGLHFGVDRSASLQLLGQAALTLNLIVSPERSRSALLQTIEETVATIRTRAAGGVEKPRSKFIAVG
jgi:response regulator RpfG family c-di-GMP phosphodiesterase